MSTPSAKRALNFGSTPRKRARMTTRSQSRRVYGTKPEMKYHVLNVTHVTSNATTQSINEIPGGPGVLQRVGAKVKIWNIEWVLACQVPTRVDLILANQASDTPTNTYPSAIDRTEFNQIEMMQLHPPTTSTAAFSGNVKLPLGLIAKYNLTAGSSINKGKLYARITSQTNQTVTGYFRIWYTDV